MSSLGQLSLYSELVAEIRAGEVPLLVEKVYVLLLIIIIILI